MPDSFDQLVRACAESQRWPSNLLRLQRPNSLLVHHRHQFEEEAHLLFAKSNGKPRVKVWEGSTDEPGIRQRQWNSVDDLQEHFNVHLRGKVKDPNLRHVRSPLDFHHTSLFQHIDRKDSSGLEIRTLGRSGYEIRVGYKLAGMEKIPFDNDLTPVRPDSGWALRRTAVYHSLDLETGRSFWVTTKANDVISKRVMEASSAVSEIPHTSQAALSNALQTHLITATWCSEGWKFYINSLEPQVSMMLKEMLNPLESPVDERLHLDSALDWARGQFDREVDAFAQLPSQDELPPLLPLWTDQKANSGRGEHNTKKSNGPGPFSFGMQQLSSIGLKLREARMVMRLNVSVLTELREYYLSLFEAPDLPRTIKECCAIPMHDFKRRMNALERYIESESMRCDALISQLEEGKNLYNSLIQFQSIKIERKMLDKNSRNPSDRMYDAGPATEPVTASVHIITLFTVITLPGTFFI
ncbi:hypothetical protein E8E14_005356 [Neopestalotiopsis sp. 37M]|nr:hypothetical protein E8E14_005356 [Neopestalotiopsis sp. 37M]